MAAPQDGGGVFPPPPGSRIDPEAFFLFFFFASGFYLPSPLPSLGGGSGSEWRRAAREQPLVLLAQPAQQPRQRRDGRRLGEQRAEAGVQLEAPRHLRATRRMSAGRHLGWGMGAAILGWEQGMWRPS